MIGRLSKSWVILREKLMRVRVVHRHVRGALGKQHASILTIFVVFRRSVTGKVGRLVDNGPSLHIVNG